MKREEAILLLESKIKSQNLLKHLLAAEAGMRKLAAYFNEDEEKWALTGLLHDIDYEETKDDSFRHSLLGAEILEQIGIEKEITEAVKTHNEAHGIAPDSKMAKCLFCLDPLTGLIVASVLVLPSKKIKDLTTGNILNRFKEKGFAKGANREIINKCQKLFGLPLEKFVSLVLEAMQNISGELGL